MKLILKVIRNFLFLIMLVTSSSAFAVNFYLPEVRPTETKGFTDVILSGKAKAGATVEINKAKIPYVNKNNEVELLSRDEVLGGGSSSVRANKKGYFQFKLRLPNEKVQLPIKVVGDSEKDQLFQLNLVVTDEVVTVENEDKLEQSPELRKKYGAWLGFGYNYLNYAMDSVEAQMDVGYESFKGPTYFLDFRWWASDEWVWDLTYKTSPGSVSSGVDLTITNGDYDWTIAALHGTYYDPRWRPNLFGKFKARVGMIFGVQHHTVPFLKRLTQTPATAEVVTNTLTMVAAGGKIVVDKGRGWAYEVFMRTQIPVASGSQFNVNHRMAFDGSLGAYYNFPNSGLRAGMFWYGQYHQYAFTTYDVVENGNIAGNQALLFSTLEARVGWAF